MQALPGFRGALVWSPWDDCWRLPHLFPSCWMKWQEKQRMSSDGVHPLGSRAMVPFRSCPDNLWAQRAHCTYRALAMLFYASLGPFLILRFGPHVKKRLIITNLHTLWLIHSLPIKVSVGLMKVHPQRSTSLCEPFCLYILALFKHQNMACVKNILHIQKSLVFKYTKAKEGIELGFFTL